MNNKKIMLILPLMLLVLSVFVLAKEPDTPDPPFGGGGNGGDEEPPPQNTYDSTLQITKITAAIDGKKDTIKNSGEKISREAKEESDIEFEITIKNIWDKKIEDIDITITIEDIDDNDDLEEDSDISKLDPGDSKEVNLDFDLPLKVDDDNYDVKIHVEGKDENNSLHIIDWKLTLEVKKDKHNVKITKALLSPSAISCQRTANLEVKILNLGRDKEDIKIELKSNDLGINFQKEDIELDIGTDDDAEYQTAFRFTIPEKIEAGTYPITINSYYNKDKSVTTKKVNLIIEECIQTKQSLVSIKTLPPSPSETLGKLKTKTPETLAYTSDQSTILLLTVILIIVLGLIIFLLGVIMVELRR